MMKCKKCKAKIKSYSRIKKHKNVRLCENCYAEFLIFLEDADLKVKAAELAGRDDYSGYSAEAPQPIRYHGGFDFNVTEDGIINIIDQNNK